MTQQALRTHEHRGFRCGPTIWPAQQMEYLRRQGGMQTWMCPARTTGKESVRSRAEECSGPCPSSHAATAA